MNEEKISRLTDEYRSAFTPEHWKDENYKWQAVKCFQDNWKTNSSNFLQMFNKATSEHYNLLASGSFWQPRAMMEYFCNVCGEAKISEQFESLFDETIDLRQRIIKFMDFFKSDDVIGKVNAAENKNWKSNQDTRAVSVYLASKYPDKYYFYMENLYCELKELFGFKQPKGFSDVDKLIKYFEFCDEICDYIKTDHELTEKFGKYLSPKEYQDKNFHILTQDVVFFIKNSDGNDNALKNISQTSWDYENYDSGITVDKWVELLNDKSIFTESRLEIMKRIKDFGGIATCTQLSEKYGETPNFYNRGSTTLAECIAKKTGCVLPQNSKGFDRNWPILYVGRKAEKDEGGSYIWKIRDELSVALDKIDLSGVKLYAKQSVDLSEYNEQQFLNEVYISSEEYHTLHSLLTHKKNIILQGAPGVGKTFAAKRLAYAFMGEKDESRVKTVQFHQSCSYEDFVEGYRPAEDGGFTLNDGVFKKFCKEAETDSEHSYFFIIDEINRGNLSKIFGELLMLIEADKRGEGCSAELVYSGDRFSVPENLYIIGMMNTADRSLAMIDYALRRRFAFYTMKPAFENPVFKCQYKNVDCKLFHKAVSAVCELNKVILDDKTLGKGFEIGHSYFCKSPDEIDDVLVKNIIRYELIPTIEEYWFDNENKLNGERAKLEALLTDGEENETV